MTLSQAAEVAETVKAKLKNHGYKYEKTHDKYSEVRTTYVYKDSDSKIKIFVAVFRDINENPNIWSCLVWAFTQKTMFQLKINDDLVYVGQGLNQIDVTNSGNYISKIKKFIKKCDELVLQEQSK